MTPEKIEEIIKEHLSIDGYFPPGTHIVGWTQAAQAIRAALEAEREFISCAWCGSQVTVAKMTVVQEGAAMLEHYKECKEHPLNVEIEQLRGALLAAYRSSHTAWSVRVIVSDALKHGPGCSFLFSGAKCDCGKGAPVEAQEEAGAQ